MAQPISARASESALERESTGGLFSRAFSDFTSLLRNEVALAKAELSESTSRAKAGLAALIGAVSTLLAGSLALVAAIILGLAKVMEPWLAALIVGVAISAVGVALLFGAKKKLVSPHIEIDRTRAAVRSDVNVLARRT
ncbi:MAG TPA: phage holin family protein [Steroidobacteraceae bacterium]|nr:phage holin family protein [Steroidobacteraceae bacterium]